MTDTHRGDIRVYSSPGETRFQVRLPIIYKDGLKEKVLVMDKATGLGKTQILEEIRISDLQYTLPIQDHNNNNSNSTNMRRLISVFLENSWHLLLSGSHFMLESIVYSFPRIKLIIYYIWLISLHSSAHILY